ncbi:MAG: tyrosine-type recombinase/integrase [Acidobacteria bacterium]|nr:tyrosine-type recombinase/integrase [Acidobacteriota bacterium]
MAGKGRLYQQKTLIKDEFDLPLLDAQGRKQYVLRSRFWWARFRDANGKIIDRSTDKTKRGEAQGVLNDWLGRVSRSEPVGGQIGRVTFEQAAEDIVNDYTVNARRSLGHLQRRFKLHLTPAFGGRRLANITTADVRAFTVTRLDAGASRAEINRELAILKRMFTLAVQGGKLLHRPHIPMLKESNTRTGFFERHEYAAVRAELPAHLRPLVTFAYLSGWRVISEVLPLRFPQLDLTAGTVCLLAGTTKNDEPRTFHFAALTELRECLTDQATSAKRIARASDRMVTHVFHDPTGAPISPAVLRKAWGAACTAAGYPGKLLHDFRRSAVRNLVRAGIPERVAMQLTGHKTRSVFERYNIVAGTDLADAAVKLEAYALRATEQHGAGKVRPFTRAKAAK